MPNDLTHSDVQVELSNKKDLRLHVTVRTHADMPLTLNEELLPWGNRDSIILVAVTPDGRFLKPFFPIDDPGFEKVSIAPGESLGGDIALEHFFRDFKETVKRSDVNLFWAYESPVELHIARRSGGWILVGKEQ